ncbi:MAG: zinc-ribbon domain containing protein [Chloroflexota bacterium]
MAEDKELVCADCGKTFVFTAGEQEFYASRGLTNEPRRCPDDRQARKQRRSGDGGGRGTREMYPATCANCGNETQVPFRPTGIRPVYCSDCFSQMRS